MTEDNTIMIVDDDDGIRTLIKAVLEREGYPHVVEAQDGVSAYRMSKARKIDLIISDWHMIGMTGLELLIKIRGDQEIGQTPFIMISAGGPGTKRDEAFKNGANAFIAKPFSVEQLADNVARLMNDRT